MLNKPTGSFGLTIVATCYKLAVVGIVSLFIAFALFSCNSVKPGVYKSTCKIYHVPQLILLLNNDKTFEYKRPYIDEKITGIWDINQRKELVLQSEMFNSKEKISPDYKFTENIGNDVYKISGSKLLIYDANGKYEQVKCQLIRINNDVTLFEDYKFF